MQTRIQTFGQQYYWSRSNLSPVHTYHKCSWNVTFNILSRKVKFIRLQNFTAFFLQEATFQVYKLGKEKKKNRRRNKTFAFRSIDASPSDQLENTNCKVPSTGNLPSRCARLVFFPSTTKEESSWHAIRGRRRGQSVSPSRRGRGEGRREVRRQQIEASVFTRRVHECRGRGVCSAAYKPRIISSNIEGGAPKARS